LDVKTFFTESLLKSLQEIPEVYRREFKKFAEDECVKLIPELEVDYTPVLTIPYENLPKDLRLWEHTESWLLDENTKVKIKEENGSLVAKSMDKDATRASMIWRLSINSAPVMQNIFNHLGSRCSARKILRLIKDIKNVALVGTERDFLKSYNVKQAMIWCLHQNPDIHSEPDLLVATLNKMLEFFEKKTLPSFLEPKRNLIYKMAKNGKLEDAKRRVIDILSNMESYLGQITAEQRRNRKGIEDVQQLIKPMASFLLLPVISDKISKSTAAGINANFRTADGVLRSYFEENEMTEIKDKAESSSKVVTEIEALKSFTKEWVDSVLIYLTETGNEESNPEEKVMVPSLPSLLPESSDSPQLGRVAQRNLKIVNFIVEQIFKK